MRRTVWPIIFAAMAFVLFCIAVRTDDANAATKPLGAKYTISCFQEGKEIYHAEVMSDDHDIAQFVYFTRDMPHAGNHSVATCVLTQDK